MTMPPPGGPPASPPYGGDPAAWSGPPTPEERNWALASHIATPVSAWFAMGFLAPLLVLLVKGNDSAFVRRHAVESLNFQITLLVYLVVSAVLVLVLIGIVMLALLAIFAVVVIIQATLAAANGRDYRYPLTVRLIS